MHSAVGKTLQPHPGLDKVQVVVTTWPSYHSSSDGASFQSQRNSRTSLRRQLTCLVLMTQRWMQSFFKGISLSLRRRRVYARALYRTLK